MKIFITGGSGFIGSAVIRKLLSETDFSVLNLDKLGYAGNEKNLAGADNSNAYSFVKGDVCDDALITKLLEQFQPDLIMHLAAESHVDRSISSPFQFINSNIMGTYVMLEAAKAYWSLLPKERKQKFRFHHISTDEVFGSLGESGHFSEDSRYDPSSPYSASKASSDHLVRAWYKTYKLPILITNCSNNYGPFQFPEKLIPLTIINALEKSTISIYGNGLQVRNWLYVDDHVEALLEVLKKGKVGDTYNIGGQSELTNLQVVRDICTILDRICNKKLGDLESFSDLIKFIPDRLGHDFRYSINSSKISQELGWKPRESFSSGLEKTVNWYLQNVDWVQTMRDQSGVIKCEAL
jgi:dTDP-glucose 4,6-dehydratase